MRTKEIIQSFVGTSKIVLKDVYTDAETNAIVIKARPTKIEQCRCGLCHRKGKYYDKGQGERKPGRPVKGDVVNPEKKDAGALKNLRYVLLKNPENLSANQKDQLKFLTKANPRLYRAYLLKEGLRLALKAGSDEISEALTKWMGWAQRCRIPAFRELRLKIKRHFKAIVAAATHGLSNARVEATNNKIKLIIRRAYGFRNMDNMIAMIMLSCSSVHPSLPGR